MLVKKSLHDLAMGSHSEVSSKVDESIGKEIFVFRAQMLLDENESLLLDGKYDKVISNTDRITGVIAREQSLNLLDEIKCLLFLIKTYIGTAVGSQIETSQVRKHVMDIEDEVVEGNLYKTKSDLAKILEGVVKNRKNLLSGWARMVILELNGKMDSLMELYREFPKQFFEFEENPMHILTSYLEDVIMATESKDIEALDTSILKFYFFYFQTERFMREEKAFREEGKAPTITRIDLPGTGIAGVDTGTEEELVSGSAADPALTAGVNGSVDDGGTQDHKFVVSDIKIDVGELKGIYDELKAISEVEAKKREEEEQAQVQEEGPPVVTQPQAATPPRRRPINEMPPSGSPPVKEPSVDKPPKSTAPPVKKPPLEKPAVKTPPKQAPPVKKPPAEKPPVKKPPVEKPPEAKGKEDAKPKGRSRKKSKIRTLIKDVFGKKGKKLPSYKSSTDLEDRVSRFTNAQENLDEELRILSEKYHDELKEIVDSDMDDETKLSSLAVLAYNWKVAGDLTKAIIIYDALLKINPEYKNAYEVRDECYEMVLDEMLERSG
jgi:hypothetical protein